MAFGFSEDADLFVSDGVLATLADGSSARVLLDYPEAIENFSGQSSAGTVRSNPQITFATGALALATGTAITIEGVTYRVKGAPRKIDDGVFSIAELGK